MILCVFLLSLCRIDIVRLDDVDLPDFREVISFEQKKYIYQQQNTIFKQIVLDQKLILKKIKERSTYSTYRYAVSQMSLLQPYWCDRIKGIIINLLRPHDKKAVAKIIEHYALLGNKIQKYIDARKTLGFYSSSKDITAFYEYDKLSKLFQGLVRLTENTLDYYESEEVNSKIQKIKNIFCVQIQKAVYVYIKEIYDDLEIHYFLFECKFIDSFSKLFYKYLKNKI